MPTKKNTKSMRKPRPSTRVKGNREAKALAAMASHVTRQEQIQRSPFPPRLRRTLRYSDPYALTSTSGSTALYQWKVNSLFDPDLTGSGHQPRFFDQLCASTGPYTKYRVLHHRVKVTVIQDTAAVGFFVAAGYSDLSSLPSGGPAINCELPGWKGWMIAPSQTIPSVQLFESSIATIESVLPSAVLSEDNYSALYSADPADVSYFSIQITAAAAATGLCELLVEHEYDVQFEEPVLVASS